MCQSMRRERQLLCRAGLINTHHHMFQALTRCIAQDQKLFGWLQAMYAGWQHIQVRPLRRAHGQRFALAPPWPARTCCYWSKMVANSLLR